MTWKERISAAVDDLRPSLLDTSHAIHADPELAFAERRASARLADALESAGFEVQRGAGGLPTAFRAELKGAQPGPTVAILAEYDALPDVGHGCGHNVIASSALGAGLGLARAGRDFAGRVLVIGTPGEEGHGGKIILAEEGVFSDVDAALIMHPSDRNMTKRGSLAHSWVDTIFHGKAAHAALSPDLGTNALQAVIDTFNNVNGQRIHLRSDARVHGYITHGGDAVNIIPSRASAMWGLRANDRAYQRTLVDMLRRAAEAAATSTGARLEWKETRGYDNMVANTTIADLFSENLRALGLAVDEPQANERMASTDMGDLSQILPAVHAYLAITEPNVPGHSTEFEAAAGSPAGDAAVLNGAKGLAMTTADLLADHSLVERAKAEFREMQAAGRVAGWDAWVAAGRQYPPLSREPRTK